MNSDTPTNNHVDANASPKRPDLPHDGDQRPTYRSQPRHPRCASVATVTESPWLTVHEAAERCKCGVKAIYREVKTGRLRAARIGGRRELRLLAEWVDEWLIASTTVI